MLQQLPLNEEAAHHRTTAGVLQPVLCFLLHEKEEYVASASSSGKRSLLVFLDEFIVSSDFLNGLDNIIGMKNLSTLLHGVMKTPSKKQEKLIDGNPLRRVRGEEKEKKAVEKLENCGINGLTEDDQLITEHFMAGLVQESGLSHHFRRASPLSILDESNPVSSKEQTQTTFTIDDAQGASGSANANNEQTYLGTMEFACRKEGDNKMIAMADDLGIYSKHFLPQSVSHTNLSMEEDPAKHNRGARTKRPSNEKAYDTPLSAVGATKASSKINSMSHSRNS
ncbi:hypothetical protein MUK42_11286 [Musa troglodytarum]|uniref:Uncharacterized protein n=1 Tax=Musa troglodytarum TaxID=320322 RepID=A0A9E7GQK3_9LILI|nr:hypothetical protein MUK42_11286 [Musa troglodytarum]